MQHFKIAKPEQGEALTGTFTVRIPEAAILDPRMTPGALGVLNYLLLRDGQAETDQSSPARIAEHFNVGSKGSAIRSHLKELEELGYLRRGIVRDARGRVVKGALTVSATPFDGNAPVELGGSR